MFWYRSQLRRQKWTSRDSRCSLKEKWAIPATMKKKQTYLQSIISKSFFVICNVFSKNNKRKMKANSSHSTQSSKDSNITLANLNFKCSLSRHGGFVFWFHFQWKAKFVYNYEMCFSFLEPMKLSFSYTSQATVTLLVGSPKQEAIQNILLIKPCFIFLVWTYCWIIDPCFFL